MRFDTASQVEQVCYEFKLADYPRGQNRALINDLFNGVPPYTAEEVAANNINFNVNFLGGTRIGHDTRMQFYGSFLKPGRFFMARTDMGVKHKRVQRSGVVTHEIAKLMKRSSVYYETFRSKFALDVMHGIGPSGWDTDDHWCPDALGIEDVLVPSNTLLTMKNLPFFAKYRSYTAPELIKLTRDRKRAKETGWNVEMVDKVIEWIDQESHTLMGNNWPEVWSPEKSAERTKSDGGFYAGDRVPTCDVFDFYFYDATPKQEGWKRRIILDAWSTPSASNQMARDTKLDFARNQFLFDSKNRFVADSWKQLVAFQFADLSAVAPFRYHSVRSLGWLVYAVINLQNRLRCKFNECVFENMMMLFRVKTMDEAERALKINLIDKGFIDETLQFIPAAERFQINSNLVQLGLGENERIINEHASAFTQAPQQGSDTVEKTKFQVMSEIQAMTSMISAALQQAYRYQEFEYQEIFRRFCNKNSRDPDVISFRSRCLKQHIPEEMLVPEAWEIEPERVLGAGNRTLELAIAEQLMQFRNLYDPEAQRMILRDFTQAITEDPGRTEAMVPDEPTQITESVLAAQLASGTLMQGMPVAIKSGINHIQYIDTMLISLQVEIGKINKAGGVPTVEKLEGLQNMVQHVEQHMAIVAQDVNEKQRVTDWQKLVMKLNNMIRAFSQRLEEQMKQAQQQPGSGQDPEAAAKVESLLMISKAKADNTRESHAQRTAQRQVQFEMEMKQKQAEHELRMSQEASDKAIELTTKEQEKALEIEAEKQKQNERAKQKPKSSES